MFPATLSDVVASWDKSGPLRVFATAFVDACAGSTVEFSIITAPGACRKSLIEYRETLVKRCGRQ